MKFAKYYDVKKIVENMMENKEIYEYPTGDNAFVGIYVCMDTNDFWICRINKGYNEEYERDESKYLIERNKIDIYYVMDKLHNMYGKELPVFKKSDLSYEMKNKVHSYFRKFKASQIIKVAIMLDCEDGLSNWDCYEADSLEEAVKIIDGGFGIESVIA